MRMLCLVGVCASALWVASGCQRSPQPQPPAKNAGGDGLSQEKHVLASEPAGAKSVLAMRKDGEGLKQGDEVVVLGKIGGSVKPFTGRAAFTIVETTFKACSEREGDNCPTPWDYCCEAPDDLVRGTVLVKFVDDQGKTLGDDAEKVLNLKPLQTVVVRGAAQKDEKGNITSIAARGIYVRK